MPVFPFSMFDPVHLGVDENGEHVYVDLAERNMLLGGEPGAGKSSALNLIVAHGALSGDCKLILIDGKQVELGPWRHCADMFIGPSMTDAIDCVRTLQQIMNARYDTLLAAGRRKITRDSGEHVYLVVIDEYAYFSATVGTKKQQGEFAALTRDLVARGRAAGVIVILATQRPSHQVIDPSLRDLFGYRWAFRCTTDSSSDTVLGHGWAGRGLHRRHIDPLARGVSWLLSETGIPRRVKAAYLTDDDIKYLAAYAAHLRRNGPAHDRLHGPSRSRPSPARLRRSGDGRDHRRTGADPDLGRTAPGNRPGRPHRPVPPPDPAPRPHRRHRPGHRRDCAPSTTPPPSPAECCSPRAATAAKPSAPPAPRSTSATPASSSAPG